MKILAPEISAAIDAEKDIFDRDSFAEGLLNLFSASDDPLVVALDEKWGSGKTVFAKRLQRRAQEQGFPVVYFDAFKRDYESDVFIALASTALAVLPKGKIKSLDLKEKAKSVGKVLTRVALKGAVRAATGGAIKLGDFSEANEEIAKEISSAVEEELDALIDARLSQSKQEEEAIEQFRRALSCVAKVNSGNQDEAARPLIFIVDELDRCRPDYALSVIENIKHLFSVQNVHFLILCQVDQLSASVKSRYGNDIDPEVYLEKFIHARTHFPVSKDYDYRNQVKKFIENIIQKMPDGGDNGEMKSGMTDFLTSISIKRHYSLRRIERVLTQFALCMAYSRPNSLRLGAVVFVLCDLKVSNRILFRKAKDGKLLWADLKIFYEFDEEKDSWHVSWLRYLYDPDIDLSQEEWKSHTSSLWRYNVGERVDTAVFLANKVVDNISA